MVLATQGDMVRPSLSPMELPLLTFQILTQLQYDRDSAKRYYESCKDELDLHKQNKVKESAISQQRAEELQSEIAACSARATSAVEARHDLELQLESVSAQFKSAQERLSQLETLTQQKDAMLEKQNKEISEKVSQIWTGILAVVESSVTSKATLLQTKENITAMQRGEDIKKCIVQDPVETLHNNSKLYAAEQRVQELLDRAKSLEDDVEKRSRLVTTFRKLLRNLALIQDDLVNQHTRISAIVKDHKSEILRIDKSLSDTFQNFTTNYQKNKELMEERLIKLLYCTSKEERLFKAAKSGNADDISQLLDFGVDIETRDSRGMTALHRAAEYNSAKACEALLDGGANIDALATGNFDNTPIFIAAGRGYLDVVRLLAERGANLSIKNRYNFTPLREARHWSFHKVAKYLEEKGAPV